MIRPAGPIQITQYIRALQTFAQRNPYRMLDGQGRSMRTSFVSQKSSVPLKPYLRYESPFFAICENLNTSERLTWLERITLRNLNRTPTFKSRPTPNKNSGCTLKKTYSSELFNCLFFQNTSCWKFWNPLTLLINQVGQITGLCMQLETKKQQTVNKISHYFPIDKNEFMAAPTHAASPELIPPPIR